MRFRKILLVNPAYSRAFFSIPVLPAGLGYLAESLKKNGIGYRILDMSLGYRLKDLKKQIAEFKPDLLGISCISYMLTDTYTMIQEVKKVFPSIKILIGGPHISSIKEDVFKECPAIDFAIVLEGEYSLVELCKGVPFSEIAGLIYRVDSEILFSAPAKFIPDLDCLDFPKYADFELHRYGYGIGIVSSRGCPYSCIYCSCNVIGKKIRLRSAQSVVDEIDYWYERGYREFGFQEDNPTFDRDRMFEICEKLQKKDLKDLRLMCGNGVRADRVDKKLLTEMRKAGFKRLAFGIESGSDRVLKAIKKGATVEIMERAIRQATELGFFVSLFFLVGSPQETADDVEKSIDLALRYSVQYVDFFNLVPMPGSELYAWVKGNAYFVRQPNEYLNAKIHPARSTDPVFETPEFSAKDRRDMLRKTQYISIMVRRRTLEQKFPKMGRLGKFLFWLYTTKVFQKIENILLRRELLRRSLGKLRMTIRNMFY